MYKTEKQILKVLAGDKPDHRPIWLMRQAGRYLPEYRTLRANAKDFLNLCLTPAWATEITLQPIKRFGFDAAILFADILLVPMALGAGLEFREGEGPVLQKITSEEDLLKLKFDNRKLLPVYETVHAVQDQMPKETTLIGFCGAPWTVACYMIDGNSKQDFAKAKSWVKERPELLAKLISILVDASEIYLGQQIEAGAEVLQIFDSWAGLVGGADFARWVIEPTRDLVSRIKKKYPHIPIIGFPREATKTGYQDYVSQTGVDALGLDTKIDPAYAQTHLQGIKPLQGNLDPMLLVKGGTEMLTAAEKIMTIFGPNHIFNLGHGVVPETPPEHVAQLVKFVQGFKI